MAHLFETKTCGRCGGSGRYSYNQMDGDRCFGCGGSGVAHTKRGSAARAFWFKSMERPIEDLVAGDSIYDSIGLGPKNWCKVSKVGPSDTIWNGTTGGIAVVFERRGQSMAFHAPNGTVVVSVRDQQELDAKKAAALAYQATLGASGKPLARKATAAV